MIKKFNSFINEARLRDISKLKGFTSDNISDWGFDIEFDLVDKLVKFITPSIRLSGKKIQLRVLYYDDVLHSIKDRILKRTNLDSVNEFNTILKNSINKLLKKKTKFIEESKYGMFIREHNFSIIFIIDIEMRELRIITIIPGSGINNVIEIFVL